MTDDERKSRKREPRAAEPKAGPETPAAVVSRLRETRGRTRVLDLRITAPAGRREVDLAHHVESTDPSEALWILLPAEGGGNIGVEVLIEELHALVLVPRGIWGDSGRPSGSTPAAARPGSARRRPHRRP